MRACDALWISLYVCALETFPSFLNCSSSHIFPISASSLGHQRMSHSLSRKIFDFGFFFSTFERLWPTCCLLKRGTNLVAEMVVTCANERRILLCCYKEIGCCVLLKTRTRVSIFSTRRLLKLAVKTKKWRNCAIYSLNNICKH